MDSSEDLILTFIPSLVSTLQRAERDKGSPLIRSEVLAIRDAASCVALPRSSAAAVAGARGYDDLDPEHAWEEWQIERERLAQDETNST